MLTRFILSRRQANHRPRFCAGDVTGHRHVPAYTAHRIGSLLLALVLSLSAFAEVPDVPSFEVTQETDLRAEAGPQAKSNGRLPEGTIVEAAGMPKNGFTPITVELESGTIVKGWVESGAVKSMKPEVKSLADPTAEKPVVLKKRVKLPDDELLMLKRETSFLYGVQAGFNLGIAQTQISTLYYTGGGFIGGAFVGSPLGKNFLGRFELGITQINGSASDGSSVAMNFLEVAAVPAYLIKDRFELQLGLQYYFGLGIGALPRGINVGTAMDLSSAGALAGLAYRFQISPEQSFYLKARYSFFFYNTPIAFQSVGIIGVLELRG